MIRPPRRPPLFPSPPLSRSTPKNRVAPRLVAALIHYAASNAFDAAVLVSGDDDFVPAVEAVNALGKQVWVATWSAEELSKDLRVRCFGHLHLSEGVAAFRAERARVHERAPGRVAPSRLARAAAAAVPASEAELERGLAELQRAEARLPHVSRGYFVMRWKSHQLPQVGAEREALVQQLLDAGRIEEFQVRDVEGRLVTAIRSRARDDTLREPSGDVALPG